MDSSDSEVALSPVYLHRHSRHTRSKDMAPLARGTALADILREKAVCAAGANAEVRVAVMAKRARVDAFIVRDRVER